MKFLTSFMILLIAVKIFSQTNFPNINQEISKGNFTIAAKLIDETIQKGNLPKTEILNLEFQKEVMDRIRKDFQGTREEVIQFIKKYYPDVNDNMISKWEADGSLEFKIIDGKKFYFNNADANLFRINKIAKNQKKKIDGDKPDALDEYLKEYLPKVFEEVEKGNSRLVKPVNLKLNYTVTVKPDVVPEGEVIRCWLPFPREIGRQKSIKLLSVNSKEYVVADNKNLQRTIYIEKTAEKGVPTVFNFVVSYTAFSDMYKIDPKLIQPYLKDSDTYKKFTSERFPHIAFTSEIKNLSKQIVNDEKNPFLIAKKIFTWIDENIPWASAREYSTIDNISDYCLKNMHGDCGIKTLLFMTLCRHNGIPTKWQSGWMLHPPEVNLHDWCEAYFEGYGWIPVDQLFKCCHRPVGDSSNVIILMTRLVFIST